MTLVLVGLAVNLGALICDLVSHGETSHYGEISPWRFWGLTIPVAMLSVMALLVAGAL